MHEWRHVIDRPSFIERDVDINALRQQLHVLRESVGDMDALLDRYISAEQALRRSEEQFRLLVTNVRDYAIFMLDPQGHIISWNTGAQLIKGYTAAEIIGQHFSIFYPPEDLAAGKPPRELKIAVRTGVYQEEGWRVRKDGTMFWASVVITAVYDAQKILRGFGKVTRDLTERKLAEDAQQLLRHQEIHLAREQAAREQAEADVRLRDEFLSMTAHESRTPVQAVLGNAELLQRRLDRGELAPERLMNPVRALIRQTQRLNRLTSMLLDSTRVENGRLVINSEHIDVRHSIEQVVSELQLLTDAHAIKLDLPATPVLVKGDMLRLEQVVYNLIQNALKYSPAGGTVTITVALDGPHALICVRDEGVGIPAEDLPFVFERFYRATNIEQLSISGLGLGLFLVKEFVALHGGTVAVESVVGQGTTFRIALQRAN